MDTDQVEIRKDLLGKEPEIGSFIAYNPPYFKGIIIGKVVAFSSSGLPRVVRREQLQHFYTDDLERQERRLNTPKTGFVIVEDTLNKIE